MRRRRKSEGVVEFQLLCFSSHPHPFPVSSPPPSHPHSPLIFLSLLIKSLSWIQLPLSFPRPPPPLSTLPFSVSPHPSPSPSSHPLIHNRSLPSLLPPPHLNSILQTPNPQAIRQQLKTLRVVAGSSTVSTPLCSSLSDVERKEPWLLDFLPATKVQVPSSCGSSSLSC